METADRKQNPYANGQHAIGIAGSISEAAQVELSGRELDLILAAMRGVPHYNRTPETMRLTRELASIRSEFQGEIRAA